MNDSHHASVTLYCARWLIPDAMHATEHSGIAVLGSQIVAVGTRDNLIARFPHAAIRDYGAAAILPGFVNAHSHLELTLMRNFLEAEERDFFVWLRRLTSTKYERLTIDDMHDAATWGAMEAVRAGVVCTGDAADFGAASSAALREVGLRGIVYQEVFGLDENLADEQLAKLQAKVALLREGETPLVRIGVSPHAPYTVGTALLERVADYSVANNLPLMMHAAESTAETLLLREGRGAFAESFARRGIVWRTPGGSPIEHLARCGVLAAQPLLAHCIQVDGRDIEMLAHYGARVAHCPKSNLKLGHGRAPLARMLKRNITVGLGSDSVASNNICDPLEEARFAVLLSRLDMEEEGKESGVGIADAINAATLGGAQALGLADRIGRLAEGFDADFAVVSLDGVHQTPVHDPRAALVFASSAHDTVATVIAGREVYREGRVTTVDEERLRARVGEIERKLAV